MAFLKSRRERVVAIAAAYTLTSLLNIGVHYSNLIWSKNEADKLSTVWVPTSRGTFRWVETPRQAKLRRYQRLTGDELFSPNEVGSGYHPNPWLLVPGSFLWRGPKRPTLREIIHPLELEVPEPYRGESPREESKPKKYRA